MREKPSLFIAEKDEKGTVVCVWCCDQDGGSPRPITDYAKGLLDLSLAEIFGADRWQIEEWLSLGAADLSVG